MTLSNEEKKFFDLVVRPAWDRFDQMVTNYAHSKQTRIIGSSPEGKLYYLTLTDGTRVVAEKASYDTKDEQGNFSGFWTNYEPEIGVTTSDGGILIPNSEIAKIDDEWQD